MRETGEMMLSLMKDEQNGVIVLPEKIEGKPNNVTLAESWLPYGIPFVVVTGLVLSNVVTNKEAIIPTFKRMMKNVRREDMSLDLEEALNRMKRICHGVSLAADNYTRRLFERDTCLVQPVMERLAGTEQLKNAGVGMQNLFDAIKARGISGTIGEYIGVPIPTDSSYLNRGSPVYNLRQGWWTEIFNLGMRSNPSGGLVLLLDTLEELTMILGIMLRQLAFCIRVYNYEYRNTNYRMSIVTVINDVINLYDGSTAAVAYTMPARAVAINCLTGISALLDVIRCYFGNAARDALMRSHKNIHGQGADFKAAASPFWEEFKQHDLEAQEWFGMGNMCHNMSFNVLGVERDEPAEISRKNHNLQLWILWRNNIAGRQHDIIAFEFNDGRNPPENEVELPFGMKDPRPSSSSSGLRPPWHPRKGPKPSTPKAPTPEPKPQPKPMPKAPPRRSNMRASNPPPPVMFSEGSMSADEDEQLARSNSEWTYPNIEMAGRKLRNIIRKHFGSSERDVVILTYVNQQEEPCGAYDESLIPLANARDLINDWEVLLRRTTIYLSAWADGIINPRILRKYIDKPNSDWIKLYRFVWFKSQSNYLNVFPTPKTFALATCLDMKANEEDRKTLLDRTVLPPGKAKDPVEIQVMRSESVVVISDLPFSWKSKGQNINDITSVFNQWGWNNVEHYCPSEYDPSADYLIQPCNLVADILENANQEDDIKKASIHIWIAMTDVIDYMTSVRFRLTKIFHREKQVVGERSGRKCTSQIGMVNQKHRTNQPCK